MTEIAGSDQQIPVVDNPEASQFEAHVDGHVALVSYIKHGDSIIFTHTEVPPEHEGKGIGSALIRHALEEARKRSLLVIPKCPFFAAYMQKHEEVQDLLDPAWRTKLGVE